MSRKIEFRTVHTNFEGKFHSFSYWGFSEDNVYTGITQRGGTIIKVHEQFTGFCDKNKVKIFDGSKILVKYRDEQIVYRVYMNDETQSWDIISDDDEGDLQGLYDYHFDCLVVGHIHEDV